MPILGPRFSEVEEFTLKNTLDANIRSSGQLIVSYIEYKVFRKLAPNRTQEDHTPSLVTSK